MNITGTLYPTGNLKPNLKASPSLFTRAKSGQSVNHDIDTHVWGSRFGFKKKIGNLSESIFPVLLETLITTVDHHLLYDCVGCGLCRLNLCIENVVFLF